MRRVACLGALAVVAAVSLFLLVELPPPEPAPTLAPPASSELPSTPALIYALRLENHSRVIAGRPGQGTALEASLGLRSKLRWRVLERDASGQRVAVSLFDFEALEWRLMAQRVPPAQAEARYFAGREAVLQLDAEGRVIDIELAEDAPGPFAQTMALVAGQMQGPRTTGQQVMETGLGRATNEVAARGCDAGLCRFQMRRSVDDYQRFAFLPKTTPVEQREGGAEARYTLDARSGQLTWLVVDESLSLFASDQAVAEVRMRAELNLLEATTVVAAAPNTRPRKQRRLRRDAEVDALERQAAGLTYESLRDTLREHSHGRVPNHNRFLWRAAGLLELHPDYAHRLAELALDPAQSGRGKSLILDMLANVGHAEAQAALRTVLSSAQTQARADLPTLMQRYMLLRSEPQSLTLDFLAHSMDAAPSEDARLSSAVAYGRVLSRLAGHGQTAEAERRSEHLVTALDAASTPRAQGEYLKALGNTGLGVHRDRIEHYTASEYPVQLRARAARSLSTMPQPDVTAVLIDIATSDPALPVQGGAIQALRQRKPDAGDLERLSRALERGQLDPVAVVPFAHALREQARHVGPEEVLPLLARLIPHAGRKAAHQVRSVIHSLRREALLAQQ